MVVLCDFLNHIDNIICRVGVQKIGLVNQRREGGLGVSLLLSVVQGLSLQVLGSLSHFLFVVLQFGGVVLAD